jgi:enoyl-CoA hydratase
MSDAEESVEAAAADCETIAASVGDDAPHVATVVFDRPEARNAMNAQVRREFERVFSATQAADEVRVVVLTGSAESSAFVAGADVTELRDRDPLDQRAASERPRIYELVANADTPVIARLNGHTLGGGCELALACDVRIAREGATIGQPEIGLGLIPGGGGTQRLPRLVGEGHAMRLILTGDPVDAAEAADIGLVEAVCDEATFDDRVYEIAGSMAEKSPVALEFAKRAVRAASRMDLDDGIDYEAELFALLFASRDKDEGIDAFLDGRDPEWEGR